jgi:two-component system response regulator (stage 0 sporulation protein A)
MAIDAHNKFRIVLVDDDKNFCEFIGLSLAQEFDIKCYIDPQEAYLAIKEDIPDLVLLDIAMPKLNGFGLLQYLKKDLNEKAPKIIFMTALEYTDDGIKIDEEYVRNLGADGLIRKEEDTKTIIQKIKQFLSNN